MQLLDLQNPFILHFSRKEYSYQILILQAITSEYLINIALGRCLRIELAEIKEGQIFQQISKLKLYNELEKLCREKKQVLGFDEHHLPDKKWLLNMLYTMNRENEVFKQYLDTDKLVGVTRDDLNILKQLNTSLGRHKNFQIFKRSAQQIQERKVRSNKSMFLNQNSRLDKKNRDAALLEHKLEEYRLRQQEERNSGQFQQHDMQIRKQQSK